MSRHPCPICRVMCSVEHDFSDYQLCLCKNCEHRFSIVSKTNEESYESAYYLDKHKNWFKNPDLVLYNKIHGTIHKLKSKNILDIGCGNANLLKFLKSKKSDISLSGIDLSDVKNFDDVKIINQNFLDYDWPGQYDFVVSLATIEHVDDIDLFVNKIFDKLQKNGHLFIMTMNDDSCLYKCARLLFKLGLPKAFNRLYDKHHLNHFSHRSLKKLLKSNGFKIIKIYKHNAPKKSLDIEYSNAIEYLINVVAVKFLFLIGKISGKTYLQSIVAQKD